MLIFGHRGAPLDAPENTIAGIMECFAQGADGVEVDVRLTKDSRFVLMHDMTFGRTANYPKMVCTTKSYKIKKLEAGSYFSEKFRGEKIPFLDDVLDVIPRGKLIQLELKSSMRSVPYLADILNRTRKSLDEIFIIGFDYFAMRLLKEYIPHVKMFWIPGEMHPKRYYKLHTLRFLLERLKKGGLDGIDFDSRLAIDEEYVSTLKTAGYDTYSWTVDDGLALYLRGIGVKGITTNAPANMVKVLNK